jgi:hypothetical protein
LAKGEKSHPGSFLGCRHRKEEIQNKKSQKISRTTTGGVFSSNPTIAGMSLAEALRGRREEQQQPQTHQEALTGPATKEHRVLVALPHHEQQTKGQ